MVERLESRRVTLVSFRFRKSSKQPHRTLQAGNKSDYMETVIDWLLGRKRIVNQESKGIDLAIYLINEFKDRTFTFKGL